MTAQPLDPFAHTYVVKLALGCEKVALALRGRLENVASGRRQEFESGQGLLACIEYEEAMALQEAITRAQAIPQPACPS